MTDLRLTQGLLEHWARGVPTVQATSVFVEQWAAVATTNPQMVATFVALEQWATVAQASAAAAQARAMILA